MSDAALIDISAAPKLRPVSDIALERTGRSVGKTTRWRWVHEGVNGIRLSAAFVNGQWHTTDDAFSTFIRARTAKMLAPRCGHDDSDAALAAAGLM